MAGKSRHQVREYSPAAVSRVGGCYWPRFHSAESWGQCRPRRQRGTTTEGGLQGERSKNKEGQRKGKAIGKPIANINVNESAMNLLFTTTTTTGDRRIKTFESTTAGESRSFLEYEMHNVGERETTHMHTGSPRCLYVLECDPQQ